jgi:organic hydroperoxide reductase OsmC/OhrA
VERYTATITWAREGAPFTDSRYSRAHRWRFDGGVEVAASASPAIDPEEAFVAALASCHMLWFLSIAAGRGFVVESYRDEATGLLARNAAGRLAMTEVALHPEVVFAGDARPDSDEHAALHHEAHEQCYIARSVTTEVRCEPVDATG